MLWVRLDTQLKKHLKKLVIDLNTDMSTFTSEAITYRLHHEAEVKNFVDSVPKMEYSHTENELTELLQDGDTQPPAGERE